jgi:hypothetical protein
LFQHSIKNLTFCRPERVTAGQIHGAVVQHLISHPELRHYTAESLAAEALASAFPCPE